MSFKQIPNHYLKAKGLTNTKLQHSTHPTEESHSPAATIPSTTSSPFRLSPPPSARPTTLAPILTTLLHLLILPSKPAPPSPNNYHRASIMPSPTPYPSRCSTPEASSNEAQKPPGWTDDMTKFLRQKLCDGEDAKSAIILVETEFPGMRDKVKREFVEEVKVGRV